MFVPGGDIPDRILIRFKYNDIAPVQRHEHIGHRVIEYVPVADAVHHDVLEHIIQLVLGNIQFGQPADVAVFLDGGLIGHGQAKGKDGQKGKNQKQCFFHRISPKSLQIYTGQILMMI